MNRSIASVAGCLAALTLVSCSGTSSYDSPSDLLEVYEAAGGRCEDPLEFNDTFDSEENEGETYASHSILCPDNRIFLTWSSQEGRDRYVFTQRGKVDQMIAGDRWVAVGPDVADNVDVYGGEVITE